jgi:acetolactate synthase-1/2/3 large subunit
MYTASTALLDTLGQCGVSCIFSNFGSDHPALIEAIAEARATGRSIPRIITCPNEMVALTAAQGYTQLTGEPQAVVVHVECGTQALAGAVHNAARSRTPVLIYAGMSPFTQEGELKGSRTEFIQWLQDVPDQRGIVRGYVKYENEFRTGANIAQVVHRAMQIAASDPQGPVYLAGPREVMEAQARPVTLDAERWRPVEPRALPEDGVAEIVDAFERAKRPLVVTSHAGCNPEAMHELVTFCRSVGAGVIESAPSTANFPHDDPLYQGNYWNQPVQNEALAEADLILVVDSDVPWIPSVNRPSPEARIFHIDVDPLKEGMTLWYIEAFRSFAADAATALRQLNARIAMQPAVDVSERTAHYAGRHASRAARLAREAAMTDMLTPESVTAAVKRHAAKDAVILSEGITNYHVISDHGAPTLPGSYFASGGSSLGWHGGAAVGMKLARPDREIVALTGDGSYMFSIPSTVHWMARQYEAPFLTVVFNNRGWNAPRFSALAVHPDGYASRANDLDISFDPPPDYAGIAAAAGGALALTVKSPAELEEALTAGFDAIRKESRAAVLDVWL